MNSGTKTISKLVQLNNETNQYDNKIIGKSHKIKKIFELIKQVSPTDSTVLITGESGTGKELIAKAIHENSQRKCKPFVPINCGAIPAELLESELFGYEKGAFTGAYLPKIGKIEYAEGGTFFLDEIGTLPLYLQVKFLRILQEKKIERIGSNKLINLNVRFIAATNAQLEEEIAKGRFREDLYYRLNVFPIHVPPLRERKEDIYLLALNFLSKLNLKNNKKIIGITDDAIIALENYNYSGNVRELENIIERLVVSLEDGKSITKSDLSSDMFKRYISLTENNEKNFFNARRDFEKNFLLKFLSHNNWNKNKTALEIGVHRNTLLQKIKELGIINNECKRVAELT